VPLRNTPALQVRGISGLIANVRAIEEDVQREVREVVRKSGEAQRQETEMECPKRTGFMASRTRVRFSEDGLTYNVGYSRDDFPAAFYPLFVIFGTRYMPANNFLFRVQERRAPQLSREVGEVMRRAAERAGQRARSRIG
jgi:HK97 gp10 family phage protein